MMHLKAKPYNYYAALGSAPARRPAGYRRACSWDYRMRQPVVLSTRKWSRSQTRQHLHPIAVAHS